MPNQGSRTEEPEHGRVQEAKKRDEQKEEERRARKRQEEARRRQEKPREQERKSSLAEWAQMADTLPNRLTRTKLGRAEWAETSIVNRAKPEPILVNSNDIVNQSIQASTLPDKDVRTGPIESLLRSIFVTMLHMRRHVIANSKSLSHAVVPSGSDPVSISGNASVEDSSRGTTSLPGAIIQSACSAKEKRYTKEQDLLGKCLTNLALWADVYPQGILDDVLRDATKLRISISSLASGIAKALSERCLNMTNDQHDEFNLSEDRKTLGRCIEAARSVNDEATMKDTEEMDFVLDFEDIGDDQDSQTSCAGDLEDILCSIECLLELCPSLEMARTTYEQIQDEKSSSEVADLARDGFPAEVHTFAVRIQERYPRAEKDLVNVLALANFARYERIRQQLNAKTSKARVIIDERSKRHRSIFTGLISLSSGTKNLNSGDWGHSGSTSSTDSQTGMNSSKLIALPVGGSLDTMFECPYCFGFLNNIGSYSAWRRHVYSDLRAYTCCRTDCLASSALLSSREDWLRHMRRHSTHPATSDLFHELCKQRFLRTAGESRSFRAETYFCNLCDQKLASSNSKIIRHILKHMESISLAILHQRSSVGEAVESRSKLSREKPYPLPLVHNSSEQSKGHSDADANTTYKRHKNSDAARAGVPSEYMGVIKFEPLSKTCAICSKAYATRYNLKRHILTHHSDHCFECSLTGTIRCFPDQSSTLEDMNQHFKTTHLPSNGTIERYRCKFCSSSEQFWYNWTLFRRHVVGVHDQDTTDLDDCMEIVESSIVQSDHRHSEDQVTDRAKDDAPKYET